MSAACAAPAAPAGVNDRKLKLAVVGTKFISDLFVRGAVLSGRYELYAICSRSRVRGEQYARKFGFRKAMQTVDEAAADPEVDVVYLATPNTLHFAQARLCLERGKHVIVEKPSVVSTWQLGQLLALAEERGVFLFEAMRSIHNPNYAAVKEQLDRIGTIRYARFTLMKDFSKQRDPVTGARSPVFLPGVSGGCNYHLGVYGINAALYFFGKPDEIRYHPVRLDTGVDVVGSCTLRYPGFVCDVTSSVVTETTLSNEIQGTEGILTMDYVVVPKAAALIRDGVSRPLETVSGDDDMQYEAADFARIILSGDAAAYARLSAAMTAGLEILEECQRQSDALAASC